MNTITSQSAIAPTTSLVLRCCRADMTSYNGFVWPGVGGIATAPDWVDNNKCGNGLHGYLYGQSNHGSCLYSFVDDAKWLVARVEDSQIRMIFEDMCKFQSGEVVFVGTKSEAADYIIANEPRAATGAVIGTVLECGDKGSLCGGALSVLTGGKYAKMIGGDYATMTGGDYAKMIGGDYVKMIGGDYAKMIGSHYAKITGGDNATITGGLYAIMTGGDGAIMHFQYFDCKCKRTRTVVAYVGEDGILAGVPYRLDANHKLVKVES